MGGVSGGASKSKGSSASEGFDQSQTSTSQAIYGPQGSGLDSLYGAAGNLFGQISGGAQAQGMQLSDQLSGLGQGFLGQMQGLSDPSAQIAAQEKSLSTGLGNLFSQQINPAISSQAIGAGGFGGSRQGVAQGQAIGQLGQAYTEGLGDITARANNQALQAQGMGIGSLPGMFDLGMAGYNSQWSPLQQYAGLLGGPTVLTQSAGTSYGEQSSQSKNKGSSWNAGASVG